jgi:hypothetical protein
MNLPILTNSLARDARNRMAGPGDFPVLLCAGNFDPEKENDKYLGMYHSNCDVGESRIV